MKIVVASTNQAKIGAVKDGFTKMFPNEELEFLGITVPSGVADQPATDSETLEGAVNRAKNARDAEDNADYWVGLEGGIDFTDHGVENFGWIVVVDKTDMGMGKTGTYILPSEVERLLKEGKTLSEADGVVMSRNKSDQSNGTVGALTDNVLTRTSYYSEAVVLALIPFKKPDIYKLR